MMKELVLAASIAVLSPLAIASGGHGHGGAHSDIELEVEGGELHIHEDGGVVLLSSGALLFESDFELHAGEIEAENPGIDLPDNPFVGEHDLIVFNAKGPLQYWDGASWLSSAPGSEEVSLSNGNAASADTVISDSGVTDPFTLVGLADDEGGFHGHIDFLLSDGAATGAYLIELALRVYDSNFVDFNTDKFAPTENFFIAFNYGLDHEDFEASIDALGVAPVPVPAAFLLFGSALAALSFGRSVKAKA